MRTKLLSIGTFIALIGVSASAQPSTPGQNRANVPHTNTALPPGQQVRPQSPPTLGGPAQTPPGVAPRTNQFTAVTNRPGIGFGTNQVMIATNQFGLGTNQFGIQTNQFGGFTNPFWANTNRAPTNLAPTSDSNRPNRVFQDNRLPSGVQNPQSGPPPRVNRP